jgi:hypothetical protein
MRVSRVGRKYCVLGWHTSMCIRYYLTSTSTAVVTSFRIFIIRRMLRITDSSKVNILVQNVHFSFNCLLVKT